MVWNIPAADVVNLKNQGLYMNFHTSTFPGGIIRSQLVRALLAPAAKTDQQKAVAYAAAGQFAEAMQWQEKALELCGESENADYRSRLELYRAGQPYRES